MQGSAYSSARNEYPKYPVRKLRETALEALLDKAPIQLTTSQALTAADHGAMYLRRHAPHNRRSPARAPSSTRGLRKHRDGYAPDAASVRPLIDLGVLRWPRRLMIAVQSPGRRHCQLTDAVAVAGPRRPLLRSHARLLRINQRLIGSHKPLAIDRPGPARTGPARPGPTNSLSRLLVRTVRQTKTVADRALGPSQAHTAGRPAGG